MKTFPSRVMRRKFVGLAALILLASCGSRSPEPEARKTFEATGTIVSVEESTVLIDHGEIPGFMDAMTMSFPVTDSGLLRKLEPGMKVSFRVVVDGNSFAIDEISPR